MSKFVPDSTALRSGASLKLLPSHFLTNIVLKQFNGVGILGSCYAVVLMVAKGTSFVFLGVEKAAMACGH